MSVTRTAFVKSRSTTISDPSRPPLLRLASFIVQGSPKRCNTSDSFPLQYRDQIGIEGQTANVVQLAERDLDPCALPQAPRMLERRPGATSRRHAGGVAHGDHVKAGHLRELADAERREHGLMGQI